MLNNSCPFCLSNNLLKGKVVYQDSLFYAISPDVEGIIYAGIMIVPIRHSESPFELSKEEWMHIHMILPKLKKYIDDTEHPDGYNMGWNIGDIAGQKVKHTHLHFFGRFLDEPLNGKGIRFIFKQSQNKRPNKIN